MSENGGSSIDADPSATGFAVILERDSPRPFADIGRLLAYHLEMHPTDAVTRVRYGGGLIAESVTGEIADRLVGKLRDLGVKARRISTDLWALVPRGARVSRLELSDATLTARLVGGRKVDIPRRELFALQVHGLMPLDRGKPVVEIRPKKEKKPTMGLEPLLRSAGFAAGSDPGLRESGSLGPRGRRLHDALAEHGLLTLELHLTLYADPFGPLRIQKNEYDFTSLEVDREEHSLDNFLVLLDRVLAYLPGAWNRETAARFAESLDPRAIHYFKAEEAQNLERWLYEWSRIEAEEHSTLSASTGEPAENS